MKKLKKLILLLKLWSAEMRLRDAEMRLRDAAFREDAHRQEAKRILYEVMPALEREVERLENELYGEVAL